jgi:hypothetical protein
MEWEIIDLFSPLFKKSFNLLFNFLKIKYNLNITINSNFI